MDRVRDNTSRLGLGRMSKGEVKAFHAAFVAADKSLDERVCKNGSGTDGGTANDKCKTTDKDNDNTNNLGNAYKDGGADKVEATDANNIATSISS